MCYNSPSTTLSFPFYIPPMGCIPPPPEGKSVLPLSKLIHPKIKGAAAINSTVKRKGKAKPTEIKIEKTNGEQLFHITEQLPKTTKWLKLFENEDSASAK